jgi:hypothetical protein
MPLDCLKIFEPSQATKAQVQAGIAVPWSLFLGRIIKKNSVANAAAKGKIPFFIFLSIKNFF